MRYFAYCRKSTESEERQALSIPAQIDEIRRHFADAADIEIVEWFEERMSAKAPGRPVYGGMIARIEKGEADGIVAWHPDRLARNSVDGGWLIHLLDRKILKDLKFVSFRYEQSPEGMFMLQIMFGQSKYFVDNLSVNVKRGLRKRIEMGWLPGLAPLGYRNDRETRTIAVDPERFTLLQSAWRLLLTGTYTVRQINDILHHDWGFRTPRHKVRGGGMMVTSTLYKVFANPFYAGILNRYGEWRIGKHQPMVTLEEFHRAQKILGRPGKPKPETRAFAYTGGLIRCACGLSVTAEEKIKPSGRRYVYYRCTRRLIPRCRQPAVSLAAIERQIIAFLSTLAIPRQTELLLEEMLTNASSDIRNRIQLEDASLSRSHAQTEQELRTLLDIRIRGLIDDADYVERRNALRKQELLQREARSRRPTEPPLGLELARSVISFRKYAVDWFSNGNLVDKRLVLKTLGSNSVLADKILSIQTRFPFKQLQNPDEILLWCGLGEALRTLEGRQEEVSAIIGNVKALNDAAELRRNGETALADVGYREAA